MRSFSLFQRRKNLLFHLLFSLLGGVLVVFILFPILKIFLNVSPGRMVETGGEKAVLASIFLTLRASFWATILALGTGLPLGYILARREFPGKKIVEGITDLPVIIPHTAAGIALLMMLGRDSLFQRFTGWDIIGTEAAISLGMFFVSVPFLINAVKEGIRQVDPRFEKTALTLGASRWQAFLTITLPMSRKSILSGMIMMWGRGISEFGAVVILAYHPMTAPVMIFERFNNFGLSYAVPVTAILILISLIIFVILRMVADR